MDEFLFAVGKTKFLGKNSHHKDLSKNIYTVEIKSTLSLHKSSSEWSVKPNPKFTDCLDGMPEGFYRVHGKRRTQNLGYNRQYLCELILGIELRTLCFFPQEFSQYPFFDFFYCPAGCEKWIGPYTSQKLLHDLETWTPIVDDLHCLLEIFTIGADSGFVYLGLS